MTLPTRWWLFSCWPVLITCTPPAANIIHSVQCISIATHAFQSMSKAHAQWEGKVCFGALLWLTSAPPGEFGLFACFLCPPPAHGQLCPTLSARRIQNPACLQQLGRERPTELWWTQWGGDEPLPALFERLSCKPKSLCGCLGVGESSVCASVQMHCVNSITELTLRRCDFNWSLHWPFDMITDQDFQEEYCTSQEENTSRHCTFYCFLGHCSPLGVNNAPKDPRQSEFYGL